MYSQFKQSKIYQKKQAKKDKNTAKTYVLEKLKKNKKYFGYDFFLQKKGGR